MEKRTEKTYKKYTLCLLIITVVALVVCAAALSLKHDAVAAQGTVENSSAFYYRPNIGTSQENEESETSSDIRLKQAVESNGENDEKDSYFITIYNGKIGVYKDGEATPFITADVDVYLLPEEDIAILRKGLRAEEFSEVKRILEDYE